MNNNCWECNRPASGGLCTRPHPTIDYVAAFEREDIEFPARTAGQLGLAWAKPGRYLLAFSSDGAATLIPQEVQQ